MVIIIGRIVVIEFKEQESHIFDEVMDVLKGILTLNACGLRKNRLCRFRDLRFTLIGGKYTVTVEKSI